MKPGSMLGGSTVNWKCNNFSFPNRLEKGRRNNINLNIFYLIHISKIFQHVVNTKIICEILHIVFSPFFGTVFETVHFVLMT